MAHFSPGQDTANIKRAGLPKFLSKVEDYGEFRKVFCSLANDLHTGHTLYITMLKNQLTEEGKNMIRGVLDRGRPGTRWTSTMVTITRPVRV